MNTKLILIALLVFSIASCGRRNIPTKTKTTVVNRAPIAPDRPPAEKYVVKTMTPEATNVEGNENVEANIRTNAALNPAASEAPIAVIDSKGNVVVNRSTLPQNVNQNVDSISRSVRAYTPNQAKNLSLRYNVIPPRVIYVPANLQKQGTRGVYYLYKINNNTLWYWKHKDGYFYIDENHYN